MCTPTHARGNRRHTPWKTSSHAQLLSHTCEHNFSRRVRSFRRRWYLSIGPKGAHSAAPMTFNLPLRSLNQQDSCQWSWGILDRGRGREVRVMLHEICMTVMSAGMTECIGGGVALRDWVCVPPTAVELMGMLIICSAYSYLPQAHMCKHCSHGRHGGICFAMNYSLWETMLMRCRDRSFKKRLPSLLAVFEAVWNANFHIVSFSLEVVLGSPDNKCKKSRMSSVCLYMWWIAHPWLRHHCQRKLDRTAQSLW